MEKSCLKIISGGQSGVDRAALDVALQFNLPIGGWCPRGRKAEDGPISSQYPLKETMSDKYQIRTELNVKIADGTLIICRGKPTGGTALTIEKARQHEKALLILNLQKKTEPEKVFQWLSVNKVASLNIAGPRESQAPGIYRDSVYFIESLVVLL